MYEDLDYSNSPLADPAFIKRVNAEGQIADALGQAGVRDAIVASDREGNELTADGTFGNDIMTMSYPQLEARYGRQVAERRSELQATITEQRNIAGAERSGAQVLGDAALGVGGGFVNMVGSVAGTGLLGIGAVDEAFDPENDGISNFGTRYLETTAEATDFIRSFQSDELQNRNRLSQLEGQLDGIDSAAQEARDIQAGENEWIAGARRLGRDVMNTGDRLMSDGAVAGDVISQALGSLGPSAKIAQGGAALATGVATRLSASERAIRTAQTLGVAGGVGVAEASGVLSETVNAVMALTHDQLMTGSDQYAQDISEGMDGNTARRHLAADTGREAFTRQLPVAVSLGLIAGRFEAAPVASFQGSSLLNTFKGVGSQAIEEAGQGAFGKISENLAVLNNADRGREVLDGVGENLATGAIAGAGMAGVLASPSVASDTVSNAASIISDATSARTFNDPLTQEILGRDNLGTQTADVVRSGVSRARQAAEPVMAAIRERANLTDTEAQTAGVAAARNTLVEAMDIVERGEASPELEAAIGRPDETPAPEGLETSGSLLQNAAFTVGQLASRRFKPTPAQTVYAADQFARLKGMMSSMPQSVRTEVEKLVTSPQARRAEIAAKSVDLNSTQDANAVITSDTVAESVSVARNNPTNVNPDVVNKILKESGESISEADVRVMKGAAAIASVINTHSGREIQISQELHVGLTKVGRTTKKAVLTPETASRSVLAVGYTDARGKKLRSVNDFAADVFQAVQSPDGSFVNQEGQSTSAVDIMQEFSNFVEHMNNKLGALNESFQQNDIEGRGPLLGFRGLVGAVKFVEANKWKNPVAYHRGNPASAHFARQVANDTQAAVDVYNHTIATFPDQFGSLPEAVSVTLLEDTGGSIETDALASEIDTQALLEAAEVQADAELRVEQGEVLDINDSLIEEENTPIIEEEVSPQEQTSDEQNQERTSDDTVDNVETNSDSDVLVAEESSDASSNETPEIQTDTVEAEGTETDPNIEVDQSSDILIDEDGNPIKFYHGTIHEFTNFRDGGIFLTTRKGLAREHALRGGEGTPRLIEMNAKLANPLSQQIPNDQDPDAYWLSNSFKLEQAKAAGNYDSILIFNDNEGMVVADTNDQVIQTNPDFDNSVKIEEVKLEEASVERSIHETFDATYQSGDVVIETMQDYLDAAEAGNMNTETVGLYNKMVRPLIADMQKRVATKKIKVDGKDMTLQEALKSNQVQEFRQYRNTAIVDPATGKYDQNLMETAVIALVDWLATAQARDPNRLDEALSDLGLSYDQVTDEELQAIMHGLPPARVKAEIARDVLRMWGVKENPDAPLGELEGIVQGLVSEMLTSVNKMTTTLADETGKTALIDAVDIRLGNNEDGSPKTTQTIVIRGLRDLQKTIKNVNSEGTMMTAKELLFGDQRTTYSIGTKLPNVAQTQNRGSVTLSTLEQTALKTMQDTGHFMDRGRVELVAVLSEILPNLMGFVDDAEDIPNGTYRRSVMGKNLSIIKNIEDTETLLNNLKDETTPVYYPVGITKVGRHQYQGVNPQNNKLLRALVTPTWSDISFGDKTQMDAFWLGVAQASDMFKVEKKAHIDILSDVQSVFNTEYRVAVDQIKEWLRGGDLNPDAFMTATGVIEPQVLASIHAVADMEFNKESGNETFRTSLSFELDGLTNGAANMMVNYGQGIITPDDFSNFNRVGLFIGRTGKTVNQFFNARGPNGEKNLDMYEKTSDASGSNMFSGLAKMKPAEQQRMLAAGRFAARFGNFVVKGDSFEMTRNTAKNPMTKVNYGSGVSGVGDGIADDMVLEFYKQIQNIPANTDLESYFAYPGVQDDIKALFGNTLPGDLGAGSFEFPATAMIGFRKNITETIGKVLTESTKSVIGDKITELNDMLVFSTNIQSQYLQLIFQDRLEVLAEKRAVEGKVRRQKSGVNKGKPQLADLSRRDYNSVVKELESLSPIFVSDDQTLAIGGFQSKPSELVLSSNMSGKLNQKAQLPFPEDVGVKAIPFSVIGSGDAMMMNLIFGSEGAPMDVLGIFDGLDIPVGKVKEYAPYVNEQVLKSWDRDVLAMATQNFGGFLSQLEAGDATLVEAFQMVQDKSKKSSVTASNSTELLEALTERHRQNKARKAVLKRIPLSVDQMGGSDVGYSRGEGEMNLSQINYEIQKELDGRADKVEDVNIEIYETTAEAVLDNLRMTSEQKKVAEILKPLMKDVRLVIGTIDQLNAFRQENFPDDGQILEGNAQYDSGNGIIFSTKKEADTLLHEMVHAGTYETVLDHYNGNTNQAVTRLEALMNEFLETEFTGKRVNEAKAAILRETAQNDAASKAAAVNEFMAYALTNNEVRGVLQGTETSLLKTLSQKVIQLMKRIMGGVPTSMYDQVVFNTKVLNEPPIDNGGDGGGDDGGSNGENTPEAENFTDKWIDMVKTYIDDVRENSKAGTGTYKDAIKYSKNADSIIEGYRQVGMLSDNNARKTFKAIYMILAAEMDMDPRSVITMTNVFQHVEQHLTPDMFGTGSEANQTFSAVVSSFGNYKNGDVSDAIGVMLALSQTSRKFREALDQIPEPEGKAQVSGDLTSFFAQASSGLMRKIIGSMNIENRNVAEVMNELANSLVEADLQEEFRVMTHVTSSLSKADNYVSGKLSEVSNAVKDKNTALQASTRSGLTKALLGSVTLGTNLLDKYNSEQTGNAAKTVTHMNVPILSLVPFREIVNELIGTDRINIILVAMMDEVNSRISGMRQAYREDLPGILQNLFDTAPTAEQWSSMHNVLGKTDITKFLNTNRMQSGMRMLEETGARSQRISELEQALDSNMVPYVAVDAKTKAQQLADYMTGRGAGKLLVRNAYAIVKNLDGEFALSMVEVVDELVSLYAIQGMDSSVLEETVQLWQEEPRALTGIVNYIQGLNAAEDGKVGISEQAKLNAYKGFLPNHGDKNTRVIIDTDSNANELKRRGYTKLGAYTGDVDNLFGRSYYITTVRQSGQYSQGIMQNVQSTYRGVDINTGMTVTGETSGFISGDSTVEHIVRELSDETNTLENNKETLLPVFDEDGSVMGFERAINPDVFKLHMKQEENLAVMLGAWSGRHVEEMLADQYNRALVDELDRIWSERETGSDDLFIDLKRTKDPIYTESFKLIPQGTKNYMDSKFGGEGVMVRKDHANLSVGYREASLADMWSGKTRLPKALQEAVVKTTQFMMGHRAMRILSTGEQALQGVVSSAKDIIVIKSLIVPLANTQSNIVQLASRGVPAKSIYKGFRTKLAEIEEHNKNVTKRIDLEARLRLKANNPNQRRIIEAQIQVIDDLTARMTIAPLLAAGAYKNLSEGITDLDVELSKGKLGDIIEGLADRLPERVSNVAKIGLVSKSTMIYQVANRATQYGDFLAKSIYYDHLFKQGLTHDEAIAEMNEQFVNFSFLPGRSRSYTETIGLSWFMAFKIRIAKVAMQILRENPVRALAINAGLPDVGSPVGDNIFSVIGEGRLGYSTGYEMLFSAPELNPFVNLLSD